MSREAHEWNSFVIMFCPSKEIKTEFIGTDSKG